MKGFISLFLFLYLYIYLFLYIDRYVILNYRLIFRINNKSHESEPILEL